MRTQVDLIWIDGRQERWIRFGAIVEATIVSRTRRIVAFDPDAVFALVRWTANAYGTALSRIDIVRTCSAGAAYSTLPHVTPGGELLLHLSGWPKVEQVLQRIDAIEALGLDPAEAAPDYWHHVHNRLSVGMTPRRYTRAQHRAWCLRRPLPPPGADRGSKALRPRPGDAP
ncbi:DUF2840 domain-containing protein [Maricaulis sp.]|uniref:DUF2840 domain-containing protein n=2 Tax=Maricaulis sp. TaxID=1486257 RepID=UPI00329A57A8